MSFVKEFKDFAMRGNVVDLAVGIIIGASFGKIVTSLVADVIMPPIGLVVGGVDFSNLAITLKDGIPAMNGVPAVAAVTLNYGKFLQAVVDFTIVAFAIFLVVKGMNTLKRNKEAAPPPAPTTQEVLLADIRDLLRNKSA